GCIQSVTSIKEDNRSYNFYGAYARLFRSSTYFATFCFTNGTSKYFPTYVYILIWVLSKVVAFYIIGQLMECVLCARSSNRKYVEIVRELQEFMRHKQLPSSLQRRLLSYYEYKFQKTYFREAEILSIISGQLKQDLILHSCRKLVEDVNFFQNLPTPLIIRIVSVLTTEIYLVNDVIIKANTPGECMYFIASGCVAEYSRSGFEIKHLEDGEYFGEHSLLTREIRDHSYIATETCELYRLDYSDFVKVIMSYPDLVEKIAKHAMERIEQTDYTEAHSKRRVKVTK
ncbi:cNMP binding protein, partial [Oryctes borbonicus]